MNTLELHAFISKVKLENLKPVSQMKARHTFNHPYIHILLSFICFCDHCTTNMSEIILENKVKEIKPSSYLFFRGLVLILQFTFVKQLHHLSTRGNIIKRVHSHTHIHARTNTYAQTLPKPAQNMVLHTFSGHRIYRQRVGQSNVKVTCIGFHTMRLNSKTDVQKDSWKRITIYALKYA